MDIEKRGELYNMPAIEQSTIPNVNITRISDGLEFGEGGISLDDRVDGQTNPISRETVLKVEAAIESPEILVAIDVDDTNEAVTDDGCGDGRGVKRIFAGMKEFKRSLHRAKAFGGGLVMAVASRIGLGDAAGKELNTVFSEEITNLDQREIAFGAHTDDDATGDNSGCGAIDKAPLIVANVTKYKESIFSTIKQLSQDALNGAALDNVFDSFEDYAAEIKDDATYSGRKVSEKIMDEQKVVKELKGPHLETHIVLNMVRGFTINQEYIRQVSDGKAQVFAVDVWHLQDLAAQLTDNASEQEEAFLSMLAYTLATAATLTKGDLPVYIVSDAA